MNSQMINEFFQTNPDLAFLKENILETCDIIINSYKNDGKLLLAGNGGSCADCDHIVGELMKGFLRKRPLSEEDIKTYEDLFGAHGLELASKLQVGLPAIALNNHSALNTAFMNDVDPSLIYAQQLNGYGREGDVFIGITTSGNAENVCAAAKVAKAKGITVIGLTGKTGGKLKELSDISIVAPSNETYRIQEYHLAIYHFICGYVEAAFFPV